MASLRFGAFHFYVYSNDHKLRHVHGFYEEVEVVIDLLSDGNVALAKRRDAVAPSNAKVSSIRKVLRQAADRFEELVQLWEKVHGKENP